MNKNSSILSTLLFVFLFLVMANISEGTRLPPSASKSAEELRITEQREITIQEGRILSLSPDGEWFLISKENKLCLYPTESLTEHSCVNLETGKPDVMNIVWSPDSTRIAFTEDIVHFFYESDVWIVEAATGELQNLTDDGITGSLLKILDAEPLVDAVPAWSSDSKYLIFSRSARIEGEWNGTSLYSIGVRRGGEPYKLLTVNDKELVVTWGGTYWLQDEKKILYSAIGYKSDNPDNGIWIAEWDGQHPQQLISFAGSEKGPASLIDVSVQQNKALIRYNTLISKYPSSINISACDILNLTTGEVTPLKQSMDDMVESLHKETAFTGLMNAAFSPDGSKILYVYETPGDSKAVLAVRDVNEDTENILLTHEAPLGGNLKTMLTWAENDTIYVATGPDSGLLLSLETPASASPEDALQPKKLYETALDFAHSLENPWEKELALLDMIIGLINTDRPEQAHEVFEQLLEFAHSEKATMPAAMDILTEKLATLAASGWVSEAIDLVEALVLSKEKDMGLMRVAMVLTETGNIDEALKVAYAMDEASKGTFYEANALKMIATASAEKGQFDTALEIANSVTDEVHKITLLYDIAVAFAEIDRLDKVLDIVYSLDGKFQSFALKNIALALAEAGHIDKALDVAKKIRAQDESTRDYQHKKIAFARITSYALALPLNDVQQTELAQKITTAFHQRADEPLQMIPLTETVDPIVKAMEEVLRQFVEAIKEGDLEKTRSLCHPEFLEEEGEDFADNFASAREEISQVIFEDVEILEITIEEDIATATIKFRFKDVDPEEGEVTFKKHENRWLIHEL